MPSPARSADGAGRFVFLHPHLVESHSFVEPVAAESFVKPAAETIDCFMLSTTTWDHRRFLCEPFNGDPIDWPRFAQEFEFALALKSVYNDSEFTSPRFSAENILAAPTVLRFSARLTPPSIML
jgi:hypothetical protein